MKSDGIKKTKSKSTRKALYNYNGDVETWGWPWTRLGYTYDWGNKDDHVGLSEFVVRIDPDKKSATVIPTRGIVTGTSELNHSVPSINVYIQTPDDIFFASAAKNEDKQLPVDAFFRFASNTKTFTATAILKMYEDGWLDIYDDIIDTIPGFGIPYVPDTAAWEIPLSKTLDFISSYACSIKGSKFKISALL